jgi:hypothetical protein
MLIKLLDNSLVSLDGCDQVDGVKRQVCDFMFVVYTIIQDRIKGNYNLKDHLYFT